ncbi:MAG: hypothetical protein NVS4B8_15400 [Herpetosiphon sp.]
MRLQRSLAGTWQFKVDLEGTINPETLCPDRTITVPMPWQVDHPDLQSYSGYAWYRHEFTLEEAWLSGDLLLHFGAVDYWCEVFVNGRLVGQHEGGYTPFTFAIRSAVNSGRNELVIRVYDSAQTEIHIPRWPDYGSNKEASTPPFNARNIPHGKQEWYINVGGVWQDVTLVAVPTTYLTRVHVVTDIHTGTVGVTVGTAGRASLSHSSLQITIQDEGATVGSADVPLVAGQCEYHGQIVVQRPKLWNTDSPQLYTAVVSIRTDSDEDTLSTRFGFREIGTRDGQIILNGQPFFLLSALDQDLYPDTIYTVPSEAFLRDQFQKAKELGLNSLRCHIKPPDPIYLDLADEMGLLIWAEIPSWRTFYPKGTVHPHQLDLDDQVKQRVKQTLEDMILRDFNHPSLMIWTIVNEDWGTSLPLSAADRAWVKAMYDECKRLDPTRLVVDNSACGHAWGPNIHVKSDLDDYHIYANIPDHAREFEQNIEQFSLRPLWTFSSSGDSERSGREPLVLSEFGNWGLPSLALLQQHYKGDPAWFNLGPWWSGWEGEPGWPRGVAERFQGLGLNGVWPDYESFATATQWHQFNAMKYEIETMRRQPALAGYVITELTDAYWEANGLLDFMRNPKAYHERFAAINSPDVIIPYVDRYAFWDDQSARVRFIGSHYGTADWASSQLRWTIGRISGERSIEATPRGTVTPLLSERLKLPGVTATETVQLAVALHSATGQQIAQNTLDLLVVPASARKAPINEPLAVIIGGSQVEQSTILDSGSDLTGGSGDVGQELDTALEMPLPEIESGEGGGTASLAVQLRGIGYQTTTEITAQTKVAVSNRPTAELLAWVRTGGDLLFMTSGASPFFWAQGRSGAYSGNWITSFTWLRPLAHSRLQTANPLGLPFRDIMPIRAILGVPVEDPAVQQDILAGMVAGWVQHPAVHTVQFRYGEGRVIMTTFGLQRALGLDPCHPIATSMIHDLIEHLVSDACQPTLKANY